MELVFVWIKKYYHIENVGFNFNPIHRFKYHNEENILEYSKNNNIPENIFKQGGNGEISNITAVVGNNGAGKTTLLDFILENLVVLKNGLKTDSVIVIKDDEKFQFYHYYSTEWEQEKQIILQCKPELKQNFQVDSRNCLINRIRYEEILEKMASISCMDKVHFVYYSNTFDSRYYLAKKSWKISDISTIGLLNMQPNRNYNIAEYNRKYDVAEYLMKGFISNGGELEDKNLMYFYSEFHSQIKFITSYRESNSYILPFGLPTEVNVQFADLKNLKDEYCSMLESEIINNILDIFFEKNYSDELEDKNCIFIQKIIKCCFLLIIGDFRYEIINRQNEINQIQNIEKAFNHFDPKNFTVQYFEKCLEKLDNYLNYDRRYIIKPYIEFIKWIEINLRKIGDFNKIEHNSFTIPTKSDNTFIGIQEFFNEYQKVARVRSFLNFTWGLSTGENTLLSMYARFFKTVDSINNEYRLTGLDNDSKNKYYKNALILIDEFDLTFHPEWQQKILDYFLKYITDIYGECQIQIIFTTHSPIILSDMPKSNVIFMKKTEKGLEVEDYKNHMETFGANISTLFYDSFFMKKGSIGQFAKRKIDSIISAVKPSLSNDGVVCDYPTEYEILDKLNLENIEQVYSLIDFIGEPVVKRKLQDILDMCLDNGTGISQYKRRLEKRIERYQKELKALDGNKDD